MARTLYSPRLSDDVVRALYREGKRRRLPMTRLADELLRKALDGVDTVSSTRKNHSLAVVKSTAA